MKKKLLAILALAVCVATLFTACGGGVSSEVYISQPSAKPYTAGATQKLDQVDGYEKVEKLNDTYLLFVQRETATSATVKSKIYKLYNVFTGVFTDIATEMVETINTTNGGQSENRTEVSVNAGENYILVKIQKSIKPSVGGKTDNGATVTLYDINLAVIESKTYAKNPNLDPCYVVDFDSDNTAEGFVLGSKFYKAVNGSFVASDMEVENLPLSLKSKGELYGKYVHFSKTENGLSKIVTYSWDTMSLVNVYVIPSYFKLTESGVLFFDNGNYLIQATVAQNDFSDEYDYIDANGKKFLLETKLIDVESGEETDIENEYFISSALSKGDYAKLDDSFVTIDKHDALGYASQMINDEQRLSDINKVMLGIKENGDITVIENSVKYQDGPIVKLSNGNVVVTDSEGVIHFFNDKGKLVKSLRGTIDFNDRFVVVDNKIFDLEFNRIFTPNEKATATKIYLLSDAAIVREVIDGVTSFTRYTGTTVNVVTDGSSEQCTVYENFYLTSKYAAGLYVSMDVKVQNGQGEVIAEIKGVAQTSSNANVSVIAIENATILKVVLQENASEQKTVYYRLGA